MGLWISMLFVNLLTPALMIGAGVLLVQAPPTEINHFFGYRTALSMKNKDTWAFAQRYSGRLWRTMGLFMLVGAGLVMLPALGRDMDFIGLYGLVVCGVQMAIMVSAIFVTERALKREFDADGNRRQEGEA